MGIYHALYEGLLKEDSLLVEEKHQQRQTAKKTKFFAVHRFYESIYYLQTPVKLTT